MNWTTRRDGAKVAERDGYRYMTYPSGYLVQIVIATNAQVRSCQTATQKGAMSIADDIAGSIRDQRIAQGGTDARNL